jgi:tRNA G26 N,N-dimethylase Trm1
MDLMEQDKKAAALGKKDEPRQDLESKANESKELNDKPDVVGEPKGYASQLQYLLKKRGAVAPTVDPESRPDKSYTILEALSASGLRSIRYSKELKNVKKIIANDMDNSAIEAIESNIEYNQVGAIVEPKHSNAM